LIALLERILAGKAQILDFSFEKQNFKSVKKSLPQP